MSNITIHNTTYACTDLKNSSLIGDLVQNPTGNDPLNLTDLVDKCKEVCQAAWGVPNPDLSGIGTVISYMVQAFLIALFGLYLIIPGLLYRLGFRYPERIHRNFRTANLLMAISFFVAEFSHLIQTPGIVERDFMRMLAILQVVQYTIIAYGVVAALGMFGQRTSYLTASQLVLGGDHWRILDLAPPILSIVYLGLDGSNYGDPDGWQQTVADLKSCPNNYNTVMAGENAFDRNGVRFSCADVQKLVTTWLFYTYAALMGVQTACGLAFGLCWYGSGCCAAGAAPPPRAFRRHVTRHRWWYRCLPKLGLALCILLTAATVISVWVYRFCVDKVVDAQDPQMNQDSQWSIGQVLAPAAWVPSVLDIAGWMYGCFRGKGHPDTAIDRGRAETQQRLDGALSPLSPAPREGTGGETKGTWV